MTDIAFHFNAPDKLAYACRLLRKAVGSGARVIVTGGASILRDLDTQLWTFSALEFIPHCHVDSDLTQRQVSAVVLTPDAQHPELPHHEVLLNLGQDWPQGFERFTRVIEVVNLDDQDRQLARQRWRRYTEQGYVITRHDLHLRDAEAA